MSEKLSRCRKELTAAIDRALEDLSVPFSPSPDNPTNQDCDLSTARPLSPPVADLLGHKGETALPLIYCPQQSLLVSSAPEKENPLLKPNVVPVTTTSHTTTCIKREPLSSKENTWLHPPIFMTDRQFLISLEDGERWRKGQLSKSDERSVKSEASVTISDDPQNPKDLADMGGNSALWLTDRLQRKPDFEHELQQILRLSRELLPPYEASALDLDRRSNFRKVLENSPEDEEIIETLLDMEEDYRLNSFTLRQLH